MLDKEYQYYLSNKERFFEMFNNDFVIIKDQNVLKSSSTLEEAYEYLVGSKSKGFFLVQKCTIESQSRTAMFHF